MRHKLRTFIAFFVCAVLNVSTPRDSENFRIVLTIRLCRTSSWRIFEKIVIFAKDPPES